LRALTPKRRTAPAWVPRGRRSYERARILRAVQKDGCGRTGRRCSAPHRTLVAAAHAQIPHWRPLEAELVGVGIETQAVFGIAVSAFHRQRLCKRGVVDQRRRNSVNASLTWKSPETGSVGRRSRRHCLLACEVGRKFACSPRHSAPTLTCRPSSAERSLMPYLRDRRSRAREHLFGHGSLDQQRDRQVLHRRAVTPFVPRRSTAHRPGRCRRRRTGTRLAGERVRVSVRSSAGPGSHSAPC